MATSRRGDGSASARGAGRRGRPLGGRRAPADRRDAAETFCNDRRDARRDRAPAAAARGNPRQDARRTREDLARAGRPQARARSPRAARDTVADVSERGVASDLRARQLAGASVHLERAARAARAQAVPEQRGRPTVAPCVRGAPRAPRSGDRELPHEPRDQDRRGERAREEGPRRHVAPQAPGGACARGGEHRGPRADRRARRGTGARRHRADARGAVRGRLRRAARRRPARRARGFPDRARRAPRRADRAAAPAEAHREGRAAREGAAARGGQPVVRWPRRGWRHRHRARARVSGACARPRDRVPRTGLGHDRDARRLGRWTTRSAPVARAPHALRLADQAPRRAGPGIRSTRSP